MKIVFCPGSCIPFHAYSLNERPLGGLETAIIHLANALQKLGNEAIVYTTHTNIPESPVKYISFQVPLEPCDLLIAVRDWNTLLGDLPAKKKMFWTGDNSDQIQTVGMGDRRVVSKIDAFLAVSAWQANDLCGLSGFPPSKVYVLRNGINLEDFNQNEERCKYRLIYSSTPFRGLDLVPQIIGPLKEKYPELEWHIFSGYQVYSDDPNSVPKELVEQWNEQARTLLKIPGVVLRGNIKQSDLAKEFSKATILAYPNTYKETSCMTVMEAQAAGCPIVTSALAALPETVGDSGVLIKGTPSSTEYIKQFIGTVDMLLADPAMHKKLSDNGKKLAQLSDWNVIAKRFINYLHEYHRL